MGIKSYITVTSQLWKFCLTLTTQRRCSLNYGVAFPTFKQAAARKGFLEDDNSIHQCLLEAATTHIPSTLHRLFVTILVYCEPIGVRNLWEEFHSFMKQDYLISSSSNNRVIINILLRDLNALLQQHGKRIRDYNLPQIYMSINCLTTLTALVITTCNQSVTFFVDGPDDTEKTYLYHAILASLRRDALIAIAIATSGIVATILPGGRIAHSRFKIPIDLLCTNTCSISKQSDLVELLSRAVVLIWDKATMTHRKAVEALDRTLRDMTGMEAQFGGKVMILGGDFRQVLPVVPCACIVKFLLWNEIQVIRLKHNMRAQQDPDFAEFLLHVGDGNELFVEDDMIRISDSLIIPWHGDESIGELIGFVFPRLEKNAFNISYMVDRAIITPRNEDFDKLNEVVLNSFLGE